MPVHTVLLSICVYTKYQFRCFWKRSPPQAHGIAWCWCCHHHSEAAAAPARLHAWRWTGRNQWARLQRRSQLARWSYPKTAEDNITFLQWKLGYKSASVAEAHQCSWSTTWPIMVLARTSALFGPLITSAALKKIWALSITGLRSHSLLAATEARMALFRSSCDERWNRRQICLVLLHATV